MASILTLRITATCIHGIAQMCTFLRLAYQTRNNRLWLDDGFAALAMVASFVWLVCYWIQTDLQDIGPVVQTHAVRLRAYWADSVTFLAIIWFTRISVLMCTIRLAPPGLLSRQIPFFACIVFFLMWLSLLAQRVFFCYSDRSWQTAEEPQCTNQTMRTTELAFELFSGTMLLASPLVVLVTGVVTSRQHRLLLITFLSSLVFIGVSVAHAVYTIFSFGSRLEQLTAIIQSGTSLLFTNLVVGTMFLHRRVNPDVEYPDELAETYTSWTRPKRRSMKPRPNISIPLNTVRLKGEDARESFGTSFPVQRVYRNSTDTLTNEPTKPVAEIEDKPNKSNHQSYQSSMSGYPEDRPNTRESSVASMYRMFLSKSVRFTNPVATERERLDSTHDSLLSEDDDPYQIPPKVDASPGSVKF